jgi:hypothetical protein
MVEPVTGTPLAIGLQEWAACCRALGDGRVVLTVRKGGIHERGGGLFKPEHDRFALMPTYLHQNEQLASERARVRSAYQADLDVIDPAPGFHRISVWAEVTHVWRMTTLIPLVALGPELVWTQEELAKRFAYKGEHLLHVLALRVMRLPRPIDIPDRPSYAGCRSWIPLEDQIPTAGSTPVMATGTYEIRIERIGRVLQPGKSTSQILNIRTRRPQS